MSRFGRYFYVSSITMPRRMRPRARRVKRKGNRRGRARIGAGSKAQFKVHRFQYKLKPQVLYSPLSPGGSVVVSTNPNAGLLPVIQGNIAPTSSATLPLSGFIDWGMSSSFQLADCANFAALANRFDAYRIDRVTLEIQYLNNISAVNTTGALPTFWIAYDQDDVVTPTVQQTVGGITGCRKWQPTSNKTSFKFSFKPTNMVNLRTAAVGFAGTTQLIKAPGFINCGSPTATHMGLKVYVTDWYAPSSGITMNAVRLNWTYNVSYRSPIDLF